MRVEQAQLPDDVREAALCEVGKLERNSDQSAEFGDIRTWLDTILDLPWNIETLDSIDIQGSREVEATLRRLIEPAAAEAEPPAYIINAATANGIPIFGAEGGFNLNGGRPITSDPVRPGHSVEQHPSAGWCRLVVAGFLNLVCGRPADHSALGG
jgi:hypothetical protein